MTDPETPRPTDDDESPAEPPTSDDAPRETRPARDRAHEPHLPPHPPFARTSDEYTDPPGHHRRGPNGPALDVGA